MANRGNKILIANYYASAGGPIVLSALCATLRNLGYDAEILIWDYPYNGEKKSLYSRIVRNLKNILIILSMKFSLLPSKYKKRVASSVLVPDVKFKLFPFFNKKYTIVIYPEVIWDNPLHAKNTVRWLLNKNSYPDDSFADKDVFIAFREIFNDEKLNPERNIVQINYFNNSLYRQYNFGERNGNCYILRKGKGRPDVPNEFDGPVFDDNMSDEEFVNVLNTVKYCYSFDTQTFYTSIAAVCGCIPIVVLEPGKSASDYLSQNETHYGIAYGNTPDQIEYAIETRKYKLESLDFRSKNITNAMKLINIIEKRFGTIKRLNRGR